MTSTQTQLHRSGQNEDLLLDIEYVNPGAKTFLANPTPPMHLMGTNSSIRGTIAAAAISIANKKYGLRPRGQISPSAKY